MTDAIAKLRALEDAATPAPWREGAVERENVFCAHGATIGPERVLARMNREFPGFKRDAALIAAMRNALPALLDLVEAADEVRDGSTTQTRRNYDTKRAALAQALEVTDG